MSSDTPHSELSQQPDSDPLEIHHLQHLPPGIHRHYLALERCDGTLQDWLSTPAASVGGTVSACRQLAAGLAFLHDELRVVHRDIKPSNVLTKDGVPKLSDMGIAKVLAADATRHTATHSGGQAGTAGWQAREVVTLQA